MGAGASEKGNRLFAPLGHVWDDMLSSVIKQCNSEECVNSFLPLPPSLEQHVNICRGVSHDASSFGKDENSGATMFVGGATNLMVCQWRFDAQKTMT